MSTNINLHTKQKRVIPESINCSYPGTSINIKKIQKQPNYLYKVNKEAMHCNSYLSVVKCKKN